MALPFSGVNKASVAHGLISKIEIRQQGTGSFLVVGQFRGANLNVEVVTQKGDPAGTAYAQYLRYSVQFDIMQTGTAELTALAGTAGTGLYETDVELKLTYKNGRVITLGAVSGYPLRLVAGYKNDSDLQIIPCTAENIEPITTLNAKVA